MASNCHDLDVLRSLIAEAETEQREFEWQQERHQDVSMSSGECAAVVRRLERRLAELAADEVAFDQEVAAFERSHAPYVARRDCALWEAPQE